MRGGGRAALRGVETLKAGESPLRSNDKYAECSALGLENTVSDNGPKQRVVHLYCVPWANDRNCQGHSHVCVCRLGCVFGMKTLNVAGILVTTCAQMGGRVAGNKRTRLKPWLLFFLIFPIDVVCSTRTSFAHCQVDTGIDPAICAISVAYVDDN